MKQTKPSTDMDERLIGDSPDPERKDCRCDGCGTIIYNEIQIEGMENLCPICIKKNMDKIEDE